MTRIVLVVLGPDYASIEHRDRQDRKLAEARLRVEELEALAEAATRAAATMRAAQQTRGGAGGSPAR